MYNVQKATQTKEKETTKQDGSESPKKQICSEDEDEDEDEVADEDVDVDVMHMKMKISELLSYTIVPIESQHFC